MYFQLPFQTQQHASSRPNSSHNRYPLTSPTPTPASVCVHNSCATRRDSHSSDPNGKKARALLSRVASSPVVPKSVSHSHSHPSSPVSTHSQRNEQEAPGDGREPGVVGPMERRWSEGYEAAKGWTGHQQRDGYISFPSYETYFPSYDEDVPANPQRQPIKT